MTRSWNFTLPLANTWYNLWTLITQDPSFKPNFINSNTSVPGLPAPTGNDFSTTPYIDNLVKEYKYLNMTYAANMWRADNKLEKGQQLTSGSEDVSRSSTNSIDLKNENWITDTAGANLFISIVF